jgi:hypothetical protein
MSVYNQMRVSPGVWKPKSWWAHFWIEQVLFGAEVEVMGFPVNHQVLEPQKNAFQKRSVLSRSNLLSVFDSGSHRGYRGDAASLRQLRVKVYTSDAR